jgi:hypothetical protein
MQYVYITHTHYIYIYVILFHSYSFTYHATESWPHSQVALGAAAHDHLLPGRRAACAARPRGPGHRDSVFGATNCWYSNIWYINVYYIPYI